MSIYDQGQNGIGRLIGIEDQIGRVEYRYDARGNLVEVTHRFNVDDQAVVLITSYAYDLSDNLEQVVYPSNRTVNIDRNALSQIERIAVNSNDLAYNIQYQPFGPLTQLNYGNGLQEVRSYDLDYQITHINISGVHDLNYDYDLNSNILNVADMLNSAQGQDFAYDALDRLLNAQGNYGALSYEYDLVGNRLSLTQDSAIENYSYGSDNHYLLQRGNIQYQYDEAGNTVHNGQFAFRYNQANRLSLVQDAAGKQVADYRYNALGQRALKGVGEDTPDYAALADEKEAIAIEDRASADEKQNQAGVLETQATQNDQQAATNQQQAGTLRQEAIDDRAAADALEPQIAELQAEAQPWVDRADRFRARIVEPPQNVRDRVRNAAFTLVASVFQAIADIYLDQAEALEAEAQTLRDGADAKDQQAAMLDNEAAQLLADAEQARQDAQILRMEAAELIAQAEEAEAQAAEYRQLAENPPETKETTIFVYDSNGLLLGEYTESGNVIREYIYLNGQPLALINDQNEIYYVHSDHLGTPRKLTDQNQQVVWSATYDPFGMATVNEDPDGDSITVTNNLRFIGQYFDKETGLHYNWNRYYCSECGRYITSDPLGLKGGINTYAYAMANPVSLFDPYGLEVVGTWVRKPFPEVYDVHIPVGEARRPDDWWKLWNHGLTYHSMEHRVDVHAGFQWEVHCTDKKECEKESWNLSGGYSQWLGIYVPIATPAIPRVGFYISMANLTYNLLIVPATSRGLQIAAEWGNAFYASNSATQICLTYPRQE